MKTTLAILALTLASCSALTDIGIGIAERRGMITAEDAADLRAVKAVIETTSGK
jgi:hypothetical protein